MAQPLTVRRIAVVSTLRPVVVCVMIAKFGDGQDVTVEGSIKNRKTSSATETCCALSNESFDSLSQNNPDTFGKSYVLYLNLLEAVILKP